jgi:hypothetical protein
MDDFTRERQMVVLAAAIVLLFALPTTVMLAALAAQWTIGTILTCAIGGAVVIASMAVMVRAQRSDWRRSIFAGRFGLALALLGIALFAAILGITVWGFVAGELRGGRVVGGGLAYALGLAYLIRAVRANLRGILE